MTLTAVPARSRCSSDTRPQHDRPRSGRAAGAFAPQNGAHPPCGRSGVAGKDDRGGTSEAGFITIEGGDLQAQGGHYAAGIGAGASINMKSWAHDITVNGGTVKAAGGDTAAGIGSGWARTSSHANDLKFFGGSVQATGGDGGTGIGSGYASEGDSVAEGIRITGGTITANGGSGAPGIGSGYSSQATSNAMNIIEGGSVKSEGFGKNGSFAAGIGSGRGASSTASGITVSGGTVEAYGGANGNAAGIGSGQAQGDSNVYGANGNAGVSSAMNILVSGGTVNAYGSGGAAGIGSGGAAGIGSGMGTDRSIASGIVISDGTVTAQSRASSTLNIVGIGSGWSTMYSEASNIVVSGGDVKAYGKGGGSAVGSGNVEKGGITATKSISITGGAVEAAAGAGGYVADSCTYGAPAFGPSEITNTGENPATAVFPESVQMQAAKAGQLLDVWKGASAEDAQHVVVSSISPDALVDRDSYVKAVFAKAETPVDPDTSPDNKEQVDPSDTPSNAKQASQVSPKALAATGDNLLPLAALLVTVLAGLIVATAAFKRRNRS